MASPVPQGSPGFLSPTLGTCPGTPAVPLSAGARAGSRMEPPRLRMKSPAVTMVAQSGPLPPPLGLLGVGVLKSLQGLSLGDVGG